MAVGQPRFDPARDFVARRDRVRINGVIYSRGDPFPKESVDQHLLRRLYDGYVIAFAETDMRPSPPMIGVVAPRDESANEEAALENATKALIEANSKAQLEALGASLGLEINPRATKPMIALMIAEAQAGGDS